MGRSSDPHRRRMPWMAEKECVPGVVHSSKEKMVLDGAQRVGCGLCRPCIAGDPLEHCGRPVASYEYNTFRGKNIFNWSLRRNPMYSGQWVYHEEWPEGTHDEDATSTAIHFLCHGSNAARAHTPCGFSGVACAGPFAVIVPHSRASVQDSLVDARFCRLRGTPMMMRPTPQPIAGASWHDRCTAPAAGAVGLGTRTQQTKFSQLVLAALSASRRLQLPTHTTGEHRNRRDREGIDGVSGHQFSFNITPGQATVGINDNTIHQKDKGTATTADSDSTNAAFHTNSHLLCLIFARAAATVVAVPA
ncbi:hypothetical protein TcBrA4_0051510 [Trypanosoma cruzi]|nr:hypothetical protein TcBrA4_0051510 [Trypanosoma cruzi]